MAVSQSFINTLDYLPGGKFTRQTPEIERAVRTLHTIMGGISREDTLSVADVITNFVRGLQYRPEQKAKEYRKRTASEILSRDDGLPYVTGSTDQALVFLALAHGMGIQARYVETFAQPWLEDGQGFPVQDHVFVDILEDGIWRAYDPAYGEPSEESYSRNREQYIPVGRGRDFSELYLLNDQGEKPTYATRPVSVDSIDKLILLARKHKRRATGTQHLYKPQLFPPSQG